MKKLFAFIVLSCAISLTACNNTDNEFDSPILSKVEEMLNNRTSEHDLAAFLETAQTGVWLYDDLCLHYTNGDALLITRCFCQVENAVFFWI